ncbi:MAG: PKD domain-containing protein [Alphaproteobacteria bacterium]|nr:PKD domain-containing protein [Alphaproteobacteria bacterium]
MIPLLLLLACKEGPNPITGDGSPLAEAGEPVFAYVGEPVSFDGSSSENAARYTWTPGDGGAAIDGEFIEYSYEAPGHYTAFLEVEGADGRADTDTLAVTVVYPPLSQAPRSSATLVGDATALYAVMPDHDLIAVVDPATGQLTDHLATCEGPRSLSRGDGWLAVACPKSDTVELRYLAAGQRYTITLPWGSRPFGVVIADGAAWLALQGVGAVARVPLDDREAIEVSAPIGPDLRGLAWVDGTLLVSRHRSADVAGQWWRVDPDDLTATPYTLRIDPGPDSDNGARGLPTYLQRIGVRPDGRAAVFGGLKANIERGLYREGQPFTFETTARADLRLIDLTEDGLGEERYAASFDNRDLVSAVAFSPKGEWLFVSHLGAEVVDALDPWTLQRVGGFQGVGAGLDGLWVTPDGGTLWVLASHDRQLIAFDITALDGHQVELHRVELGAGVPEPLDPEVLEGKRIFHRSVDPRMSTDAYVSCGSCHLDGTHDGRTWDFTDRGEGLRNTISLAGSRGTAHGPIHWSANFDEVQDFENDIRGPQAGDGFLSETDWAECADTLGPAKAGRSDALDALAAYVESLDTIPRSPWREPDGARSADAAWGESIFLSAQTGCADCHPPPEYTDSQWLAEGEPLLHDVGTLGEGSGSRLGGELWGIDTPTLRGLHDTAPYLHDGSAETVRDVLTTRNPDDAHGVTSHLGDDELDALALFLLSLE